MLHDKNRLKMYYPLIKVLLGAAAYELFSKLAVLREQLNDYSSVLYVSFSMLALVGAVVAASGLLDLTRFVTSLLNKVTEQTNT